MSQKRFVVLFVLLMGVSIIMGCGGGSGSSEPGALATPDGSGGNNAPGSGTGNLPPDGGGAAAGTATLSWNAPLTNEDGTALKDLGGYRVHYGTSPGTYSTTVDVGKVTSCTIGSLLPGTYYMTVTAYNAAGVESGYSNEVVKTVS
jgi:hypothetical protein